MVREGCLKPHTPCHIPSSTPSQRYLCFAAILLIFPCPVCVFLRFLCIVFRSDLNERVFKSWDPVLWPPSVGCWNQSLQSPLAPSTLMVLPISTNNPGHLILPLPPHVVR